MQPIPDSRAPPGKQARPPQKTPLGERSFIPPVHFHTAAKLVGLLGAAVTILTEDGDHDSVRALFEAWPIEVRAGLAKAVSDQLRDIAPDAWAEAAHVIGPIVASSAEPDQPWCNFAKSAENDRRMRWLVKFLSISSRYAVAMMMCGEMSEDEARAEVWGAAAGTVRHEGWPDAMGGPAAASAWQHSIEFFARFRGKLRGRLWPMGKAHEPGALIMLAAREVNDEFGCLLPTPVLEDAARRIARAAGAPLKPRKQYRG